MFGVFFYMIEKQKIKKIKSIDPIWVSDYDLTELINDYYGFTYRISNNITGKMYIGRKYFWSKTKDKKGKRVMKESDWKSYWGSCPDLHIDIAKLGIENFSREIIGCYATIGQVNAAEIEEQFKHNVLYELFENGERAFYNNNIMSRYFVRDDMGHMRHAMTLKQRWANDRDYMLATAFGGKTEVARRVKAEYDENTQWAQNNKERFMKLACRDKSGKNNPMYGVKHSTESKLLISSNRDYSKTNWESENYKLAYERMKTKRWMTDGDTSVFVSPDKVEELLKSNWKYGRTINKT